MGVIKNHLFHNEYILYYHYCQIKKGLEIVHSNRAPFNPLPRQGEEAAEREVERDNEWKVLR